MSAADTVERIAREAIEQTGLSRVDLAWVFAAVSRGYEAGFADCRETAMASARELAVTLVSDVLAAHPERRFAGNPLPVAGVKVAEADDPLPVVREKALDAAADLARCPHSFFEYGECVRCGFSP